MPALIMIIFIVCLIVALLFVVRLVCAIFSSKVANQIQKHPVLHVLWACIAFIGILVFIGLINPSSLTGGTRGRYMRQQTHFAEAFKAGDTNVPLLEMDWFAPTVHFCRVDKSGKGSARRDVGHAIQAGVSISLDETNLQTLIETINQFPPPPKYSLPVKRQIVVGCIRSNQWFRAVYDRANIPKELEKVSEITGAYLPWYIPEVSGYPVARAGNTFQCISSDGQKALAIGSIEVEKYDLFTSVQSWSLNKMFNKMKVLHKLLPGRFDGFDPMVVTPNGKIIAILNGMTIFAANCDTGFLWKSAPLAIEGHMIHKVLAVGGKQGQFLFVAGTYKIERWDIQTGKCLGVLFTNEDVNFMRASKNGKIFVAGFGGKLGVWLADKDKPELETPEFKDKLVGITDDGEIFATTEFGRQSIDLWHWRTGKREVVPLRNSQSIYSVHWSPDGQRLAAYVDTYPASIIIYDTTSWKPIAHWNCGKIGEGSEFSFGSDGTLYQIRGNELNALDVSRLKGIADN